MSASSRGFTTTTPFSLDVSPAFHHHHHYSGSGAEELNRRKRKVVYLDGVGGGGRVRGCRIKCSCSDPAVPIRRTSGSGKSVEKSEEWRFDSSKKKSPRRVRIQATPPRPFASPQYISLSLSLLYIYIMYMNVFELSIEDYDVQFICCGLWYCIFVMDIRGLRFWFLFNLMSGWYHTHSLILLDCYDFY